MKDEDIMKVLVMIGIVLFLTFSIFVTVRGIALSFDVPSSDVCGFEFGENWKYEYTKIFGRTCVELDYITLEIVNRTKFPYETNLEVSEKYCDMPKFFSLKNWDNGCELPISDDSRSEVRT